MTLKLRQIHDALEDEVKQKRKRLVEIKRNVEERNSQVRDIAAVLMQAMPLDSDLYSIEA